MAVKVKNNYPKPFTVPDPIGGTLQPGEERTYPYIEWDEVINDARIKPHTLTSPPGLIITNLDATDVSFTSEWNGSDPLWMGNYQLFFDPDGVPRYNDSGTGPTNGYDGELMGGSRQLSPVHAEPHRTEGRAFSNVRSAFFNGWQNRDMGTWDTLFKYCFWQFASSVDGVFGEPQKFSTQDELFTYMESTLPTSGTTYTSNTLFRLFDEVDGEDHFPEKVVFRNSLLASILGRKQWTKRSPSERYGVSSNFNAPSYYTNFYNELGQRLVQFTTSTLPPTNNDNVVWHTNRNASQWCLPSTGGDINVLANQRGAAWDNTTSSWVSPAPAGLYQFQTPFLIHELRRNRVLAMGYEGGYSRRVFELNSIAVMVYPAVSAGRYWGYAFYAHGADTWATEYLDTSVYDMVIKIAYGRTFRPIYKVISPYIYDLEQSMWNLFPTGGGASILLPKKEGGQGYASSPDSAFVPDRVYMARRNKQTGVRSRWYPLFTIKKRVPQANNRVLPSRYGG
jgi:hypothetical protein